MDNGGAAAASSAGSRKAGDGVSDQFPAGLRVLVVDDDLTCLKILEKMLQICQYEVTTCSRAVDALALLRKRKGGFDVVLSDVYMPGIDGFKLLECIGLEMDLPVIMMSADDGNEVVMKGVTHGACDYLIKPVRIEALKNIWQHVVRKRRNEMKEIEQSTSVDDSDKHKKPSDDADYACSANEGSWKHSKRRKDVKDEEDESEDCEDSSTLKKPRVVWSVELHQQFVAAVNQLGIDKAVPKKIMELMSVPGLTRENVASHLQKYRLYLRRLSGVPQHQGGINTPYLGAPEGTFGSNTSFDRFGLQALAVPSQFPPQNLAALQAGLGRTTVSTGMGMPLVDQMDFQNSDAQSSSTSRIRYGLGQQLSNKQGNALHGLPPPMEPRLLPYSQQPVQSFGNTGLQVTEGTSDLLGLPTSLVRTGSSSHTEILHRQPSGSLMMQMTQQRPQVPISHNQIQIQVDRSQQPQLKGQLLVEIPGGLASGISSSIGQQMLPNEISGQVFGGNGAVLTGRGSSSYAAASRAASANFPISIGMEISENVFPRLTATGLPNVPLMGMFQESAPVAVCLEGLESVIDLKKSIGPSSGYYLPNEFRLNKSRVRDVQNISHAHDGIQNASSSQSKPVDVQPVLAHQVLASTQKNMQNINLGAGSKEMPLGRVEGGSGNSVTMDQYYNKILLDNSFRVKAENMLVTDSFAQDDIMDEFFKQQQEGLGLVDSEFDGYSIDNIPV